MRRKPGRPSSYVTAPWANQADEVPVSTDPVPKGVKSPAQRSGSRADRLVERDGIRCHYCRRRTRTDVSQNHPDRRTVDHVIPRSQGGSNALTNLLLACRHCNNTRGTLPYEAFKAAMDRVLADWPHDENGEPIVN